MIEQKCLRILVVDDYPMFRQLLQDVLLDCEDMEVVGAAEDGEAAVHLAVKHEPDVVLMDVSMPKLDGIEATKAIKQIVWEHLNEQDLKEITRREGIALAAAQKRVPHKEAVRAFVEKRDKDIYRAIAEHEGT